MRTTLLRSQILTLKRFKVMRILEKIDQIKMRQLASQYAQLFAEYAELLKQQTTCQKALCDMYSNSTVRTVHLQDCVRYLQKAARNTGK